MIADDIAFVNGGCPVCSSEESTEVFVCIDGCMSLYTKKKKHTGKDSPLVKGYVKKASEVPDLVESSVESVKTMFHSLSRHAIIKLDKRCSKGP
jgi:hypothetical protein